MSDEHTPTTEVVRAHYAWKSQSVAYAKDFDRGLEQFDRWLERVKAEAKAEALEEAANTVRHELGDSTSGHTSTYSVRKWLSSQAAAIRAAAENGESK
jgi:hypothetical protein